MANKDKPAILNVNIGTTVRGAVDDLDKVSTRENCAAADGMLVRLQLPALWEWLGSAACNTLQRAQLQGWYSGKGCGGC
jgi:hypothetical protein